MRKIILIVSLFLPQIASGADWKMLQDRGYSVMEIDMQSFSSSGALKQVTVREVFSTPEQISSGEKYNVREMFLKVNCAAKSSAIQKIAYYLDGSLVQTLPIPSERMQFVPMAEDGAFSRVVCVAK
jgi:hypothetical protein